MSDFENQDERVLLAAPLDLQFHVGRILFLTRPDRDREQGHAPGPPGGPS